MMSTFIISKFVGVVWINKYSETVFGYLMESQEAGKERS